MCTCVQTNWMAGQATVKSHLGLGLQKGHCVSLLYLSADFYKAHRNPYRPQSPKIELKSVDRF